MSKVSTRKLESKIASMLLHCHTISVDPEGSPSFVGDEPDHTPPLYYFVFDDTTNYNKHHVSPRAAAADFIRVVGVSAAKAAMLDAISEAKEYRVKRRASRK